MRLMVRIFSAFFLAAVGAALCLESRYVDGYALKTIFLVPGLCAIGLGLLVIARRSPRSDSRSDNT